MLLDLALKTLWRRKLRSLLTILGVAAAIQLYLMMNAILAFYDTDIQSQVAAFAGKIYIQRPMQADGAGEDFPSMNSSISADTAESILILEGINSAASSAVLFIPLLADIRPICRRRISSSEWNPAVRRRIWGAWRFCPVRRTWTARGA